MNKLLIAAALILAANQLKSEDRTTEIFLSLTKKADSNYDYIYSNNAQKIELKKNEVSLSKSLNDSPSAILRENTQNLGLSVVSLRGFGSNQTVVVYDGIKLPKDITSTYDLSILPLAGIDSLYILNGGWSCVFGSNAEGGVLAIKTQDLKKDSQIVETYISYGSYDAKRYSLKTGVSKNNISVLTALENYISDGFQDNSYSNKNSFTSRISYDFNDYGRTTVDMFAVKLKRGLPSGTPVDIRDFNGEREKAANTVSDWQDDENLFGSIKHEFEFSDIKNSISYSRNNLLRKAYQFGSLTTIDTYGDDILVQSLIKGFTLGFEYEKTNLKSNTYGNHSLKNYGYFINRRVNIISGLTSTLYLRYDDNKNYDNMFSPKIVLSYGISPELAFNCSAGRSWRAPNFADVYGSPLYWYAPNPEIKPEKSVSGEAAISYKGFMDVDITGYYYDIDDKITVSFDPNTMRSKSVNLGKGYNRGVEFNLGYAAGGFKVVAGANIMDIKGKNKGDGSYKKLAYSPDYKLVFGTSYKKNDYSVSFNAVRVGEQFSEIDKTGNKVPAYTVSSVYLSKKIKDLSLNLSIKNLFNERYATTADIYNGYYPADPRTFNFAVSLEF